jgi:23S rRNA (adenine-N6)-dimethyltransferase
VGGDFVVEVGGGTGRLTRALDEIGAHVVVLERDPLLADGLRARFVRSKRIEIVLADAVGYPLPERDFVVVANLPFAGSGAILAHLLRDPQVPIRRAFVIVQWDFAAKHAAVWPATLRSTYWRAWHEVSIYRRLDRSAFAPPPNVDAAVLRFERRARPLVAVESHVAYWHFLADAFSSRQPVARALRPALSPLRVKGCAAALGFSSQARPRDLDATQWAGLFNARSAPR